MPFVPPEIPGGPFVPSRALAFYAQCQNRVLVEELQAAGVLMYRIGNEWQVSEPEYKKYISAKAVAARAHIHGGQR
jgi:hypothetical protein